MNKILVAIIIVLAILIYQQPKEYYSRARESFRGGSGGGSRGGFGGGGRGGFGGGGRGGMAPRGGFGGGFRGGMAPRGGFRGGFRGGMAPRGGGFRGGFRGRGGHHYRPGYISPGYGGWWYPLDWYPFYTISDVYLYSSPDWCWSQITKEDAGFPGAMDKSMWIGWAKSQGFNRILLHKQTSNFILVETDDLSRCFLPSSSDLSDYDLQIV